MKLFLAVLFSLYASTSEAKLLVYKWKAEATFAPQFYDHQQRGALGSLKAQNFISKNAQFNLRRRFRKFQLDLDYRTNSFNFKSSSLSATIPANMVEYSAGLTWKKFVFRVEDLRTPFLDLSDKRALNLHGRYLSLGYAYKLRRKPIRVGGKLSYLGSADLQSSSLTHVSGNKIGAWVETWKRFRVGKVRGFIISLRGFAEQRYWQFRANSGGDSLTTNHLGAHIGIAKLFD